MEYETIARQYERMIAQTVEPVNEQSCWTWTGRTSGERNGYPRMNVRRDGVHVTIKPHRAIMVLHEIGLDYEHFWDLYDTYSVFQMEPDHLCYGNSLCINIDHLEWKTKSENARAARTRIHPDRWTNYHDQTI